MSTTKQKILEASLKLFNTNGISNVSLRLIAEDLEISVGNLQYHFKKREDIIELIYFQLVEEISNISFVPTDNLLKSFFNISTEVFTTFYKYHFFLLDFVIIIRKNKKIKAHYFELSKQRELEFLNIVDVLIKNDFFRKELLKNEYLNLYKRIEVISNFYFSSILIKEDVLTKESIKGYSNLISQSVYPYITNDAKSLYTKMFSSQLI